MTQQDLLTAFQLHNEGALDEAKRIYHQILCAEPLHIDVHHLLGLLSYQNGSLLDAESYFLSGISIKPDFHQIYASYAQTLFDLERFDEALASYGKAIQIAPKDPDAYFERGVIYQNLKRSAEALADYDKGLEWRSDYATAYNNRGAALVDMNRHVEAIETYAKAIILEPSHALAYSNQASALKQSGRIDEAIARYDRAILLEPKNADYHFNRANAFLWRNQSKEAIESLNKAITIQPHHVDAIFSRGNALYLSQRHEEAIADYGAAIALQPDYASVYSSLAEGLNQIGKAQEAVGYCEKALLLNPDLAEAWFNQGNILQALGRKDQALVCYEQSVAINPDYIQGHYNHGILLKAMGRPDDALKSYQRAIVINPAYAEPFLNQGVILMEKSLHNEALKAYETALTIRPDYAEAYNNQALVHMNLGNLQSALSSYSLAVANQHDSAQILSNLGLALMDLNNIAQALVVYDRAIELNPKYAEAHINRALALKEARRFDEALLACETALKLKGDYAEVWNNKGVILKELARFEEALPAFKKALALTPDYLDAHSNLLFTLNYIDDIPTAERVKEARIYGAAATRRVKQAYHDGQKIKDASPLRIGLVSGDLRNHPVGYFLESLLSEIDTSSFELVAYATQIGEDDLTDRIKKRFKLWRNLHGLTDSAAAALIHHDGVHILIDLSGHTAKNRLPVFAFKPAPVQASWLGYFATTGVEQIDYFIGDPYVTPIEEQWHFTEKIKQLPESYLCFTPPSYDISVEPLPALLNGYVTFGSFNNFSKINQAVIALWARVLQTTPTSRLFLKAAQFSNADVAERTALVFQSFGITCDRLEFEGQTDRIDYFKAYNKVDIALDPFPYPGGTTSVEGLWMGVPVIARKGNRFIGHNGETIAHNSGQSHWIAQDDDDYVRKATLFASDLPALAKTRATLRDQLLASPLCDAKGFARHFESTMLDLWNAFQRGEKDPRHKN